MSGPEPGYAFGAAIYGSVLVTALVGAMFEQHADARTMTLSLAGSVFVFWLAHAWSEVVGARVEAGPLFEASRIRTIAAAEWPLVEAGVVPAALLLLAWVGVYARDTGVVLALAAAVLQLVGWGMLAGHRTQPTWPGALLLGAFDGMLGVAIVGIELGIHRI